MSRKEELTRIRQLIQQTRAERMRNRETEESTIITQLVQKIKDERMRNRERDCTSEPAVPRIDPPIASTSENHSDVIHSLIQEKTIAEDKKVALNVIRLPSVSIEQNINITYDKQTQCESVSDRIVNNNDDHINSDSSYDSVQNESNVESDHETGDRNHDKLINVNSNGKLMYNQLEKSCVFNDKKFRRFLDHSLEITRRALFIKQTREEKFFNSFINSGENIESVSDGNNDLMLNQCFYSSSLCSERVVTSFDWCSQYKELLLSSYSESLTNDCDGVCLIWNLNYFNHTPEYAFRYQSPIMCSCFSSFDPNLIISGTYSGQIVVWDKRCSSSAPTLKTTISPQSHTHPIYCLKVIGTQTANHLISISNDGRMCYWSLNMLKKPINSKELEHESVSESLSLRIRKPIMATSMCFPSEYSNNMLIGSENGNLYSIEIDSANVNRVFDGHSELVTSVHCHPNRNHSNLFLSTSLDWTIKLWNQYEEEPLYTFNENGDSMYDVKWSPNASAVFSTVSGNGKIDLWDINRDIFAPICSHQLKDANAINKITWTPSGRHVIAGDSVGKVWLLDVNQSIGEQFPILNQTFEKFREYL